MRYKDNTETARTPWCVSGSNERTITTEDERYPGDGIVAECDLRVNADLIVTAVNHHQELITRLYNLVNAVDNLTGSFDASTTPAVDLALTEARETLKKVIQ